MLSVDANVGTQLDWMASALFQPYFNLILQSIYPIEFVLDLL